MSKLTERRTRLRVSCFHQRVRLFGLLRAHQSQHQDHHRLEVSTQTKPNLLSAARSSNPRPRASVTVEYSTLSARRFIILCFFFLFSEPRRATQISNSPRGIGVRGADDDDQGNFFRAPGVITCAPESSLHGVPRAHLWSRASDRLSLSTSLRPLVSS